MGRQLAEQARAGMAQMLGASPDLSAMLQAMLADMPLRQFAMMAPEQFGGEKLDALLAALNSQPEE